MTRSELIERLAEANPYLYRRDVERIVATMFDTDGGRDGNAATGSPATADLTTATAPHQVDAAAQPGLVKRAPDDLCCPVKKLV
jgi:hypothetical protein